MRDTGLQSVQENIEKIGFALTQIFEIQHKIYALRPELTPEFLAEPRPNDEMNRQLSDAMFRASKLERAGKMTLQLPSSSATRPWTCRFCTVKLRQTKSNVCETQLVNDERHGAGRNTIVARRVPIADQQRRFRRVDGFVLFDHRSKNKRSSVPLDISYRRENGKHVRGVPSMDDDCYWFLLPWFSRVQEITGKYVDLRGDAEFRSGAGLGALELALSEALAFVRTQPPRLAFRAGVRTRSKGPQPNETVDRDRLIRVIVELQALCAEARDHDGTVVCRGG
ncbi:MAG: hypothetical protein KIT73_06740 [Burkholderiales bacterium]|nr:hypothetical protein [Burkholderiales bacterium]